jgi:LysR family transcriptional regulator, benzoate and cis,cis-muconate-responsive activator of ben and cat genes
VELRHVRYFVAVAEMENVSRAALKLHVSQPALSRQIRNLEDEIGFSLLERTAKSVRLTDAGRAFLDNARALLQNADEAVKKARAVASAEPTELSMSATHRRQSPKFCRKSYGHFNAPPS